MYAAFPSITAASPSLQPIAVVAPSAARPMPAEPSTRARIGIAELARLLAIDVSSFETLGDTTFTTRRVKPGESLVRSGDTFESLFVVRSGFFKTVTLDPNGGEQVIGFPMIGDVIGIDGIDASSHQSEVIALEHADVVIIPFTRLAALAHSCPALEQLIYRALSRELVREQRLVWVLGTLHAESRVAAFLLNLSERFGKLGYSPTHFNLRMKRQEIGSYLGLQLETVSRALSHFARDGIATVRQKSIQLVDLEALRRIAS